MTLLELLLALALSSLVFAAIAMAIGLQLRTINVGRTEVEEAQLARALLRRMADDLRGAVAYQVIDFSSLESLAADANPLGNLQSEDDLVGTELNPNGGNEETGGADGASGGDGEEGDGAGSAGGVSGLEDALGTDGAAADALSASQDIATSTTPPAIPGVYGNQYELQIDVSRLPRPEEFNAVMLLGDGTSPAQIPSDIKTISYFLRPPEETTTAPMTQGGFADEARRGGLVRREMDRAVARYASESGDLTLLDNAGDVIAPEVTGLEFRYFDGVNWLMEWDSELMGGLPVAVEIALAITPRRMLDEEGDVFGGSAVEFLPGEIVYRMVVRLPAAQPIPDPAAEEAPL